MSNINKKLVKIFIFCSSSIFLQVPLSHNLTVSRGSDIITQLTSVYLHWVYVDIPNSAMIPWVSSGTNADL